MASSIRQVFGVSRRRNSLSFPRLAPALGYHVRMEWLILFFLAMFAFIAKAPESGPQVVLAGAWLLFFLFIAGELVWMLGRFLLTLL